MEWAGMSERLRKELSFLVGVFMHVLSNMEELRIK